MIFLLSKEAAERIWSRWQHRALGPSLYQAIVSEMTRIGPTREALEERIGRPLCLHAMPVGAP